MSKQDREYLVQRRLTMYPQTTPTEQTMHKPGSSQPSVMKRLIAERASIAMWLQQSYNLPSCVAALIASQHTLGGPLVYEAARAGF